MSVLGCPIRYVTGEGWGLVAKSLEWPVVEGNYQRAPEGLTYRDWPVLIRDDRGSVAVIDESATARAVAVRARTRRLLGRGRRMRVRCGDDPPLQGRGHLRGLGVRVGGRVICSVL